MNSSLRTQIEDHIPRIRSIVSRIARDEGMIDDLTQETCLRLIEKESLWKPERGGLIQWINAVTRNLVIRKTSQRRADRSMQRSLAGDVAMEESAPPFDEDQIAWVLGQFGNLPELQRQVIHLHYFERKTLTSIGAELGTSRQVVAYQLHKALGTLRGRANAGSRFALLLPWNWDIQGWVLRYRAALAEQGETVMLLKTTLSLGLLAGVAIGGYQYFGNANVNDNSTNSNSNLALADPDGDAEAADTSSSEINGAEASEVESTGNNAVEISTPEIADDNKTSEDEKISDIYDKLQTYAFHALKDNDRFSHIWEIHYGEVEDRRNRPIPELSSNAQLEQLEDIFAVSIEFRTGFNDSVDLKLNYGERNLANCLNEICEALTIPRTKGDRREIAFAVIGNTIVLGIAHDFEEEVHATRKKLEISIRDKRKAQYEARLKSVDTFLDKTVEWDFDDIEIGKALGQFAEKNEVPLRVYTDTLWAQKISLKGSGLGRDMLAAIVANLEPAGQIEWKAKEGNIWVFDRKVVDRHRAERAEAERREDAEEEHEEREPEEEAHEERDGH